MAKKKHTTKRKYSKAVIGKAYRLVHGYELVLRKKRKKRSKR